jgi:hypothetical protein
MIPIDNPNANMAFLPSSFPTVGETVLTFGSAQIFLEMVLQFSDFLFIQDTDCPNDSILFSFSEPDIVHPYQYDLAHFGFAC